VLAVTSDMPSGCDAPHAATASAAATPPNPASALRLLNCCGTTQQ